MTRLRRFLIPSGLVLGALLAVQPVAAAASVSVPARDGWVPTGVSVRKGDVVRVRSLGSVHTAPIPDFLVPGEIRSASGPAGQTWGSLCGDVEDGLAPEVLAVTGECAVDEAYFGELVGRVGTKTVAIGAASSFVAPATGLLELAANDLLLTTWDNTGTFTVHLP